jgi:hypothetical protein
MYSLSTVSNQSSIIASYAGTRFGWPMSMACRIPPLNDHQKPFGTGSQIRSVRSASFAGENLFRRGCLLVALSDLFGQDGLD